MNSPWPQRNHKCFSGLSRFVERCNDLLDLVETTRHFHTLQEAAQVGGAGSRALDALITDIHQVSCVSTASILDINNFFISFILQWLNFVFGCCKDAYSCFFFTPFLLPACHNFNRFVASFRVPLLYFLHFIAFSIVLTAWKYKTLLLLQPFKICGLYCVVVVVLYCWQQRNLQWKR